MALFSKKNNFIYCHIYKTGGNSVRDGIIKTIGDTTEEIGGVHIDMNYVKYHFYSNNDIETFNDCYKFTVIRNPYTWWLSLYFYIRRSRAHKDREIIIGMSLKEFIKWSSEVAVKRDRPAGANRYYLSQYEFIHDGSGKLLVDEIFVMENLINGWVYLYNKINVDMTNLKVCPFKNVSGNYDKNNFMRYYDDETRELVKEFNKNDFELINNIKHRGKNVV